MNNNKIPYDLTIIAGPCSITDDNVEEIIHEIAPITTPSGSRAIYGTRVVGLKSRTALLKTDTAMGMDWAAIKQRMEDPSKNDEIITLPSVEIAERIAKETGLVISTEIMMPHIQLPFWEKKEILQGNVMIWNPAVEQLGWHLYEMSSFAKKNNWQIGIKHGKFLGKDPLEIANHPEYIDETTLEKVLVGLTTYVQKLTGKLIIIHRGLDVPGRGDYRNAIAHEIMKRVKTKLSDAHFYFDSTHSIGPKMRHKIIEETIDAMKLTHADGFLYDGLLMEVGTSPTDTDEHITTKELQYLVTELSAFRELKAPTMK
jgi:3-deoxy-D-arabino-heptulosonate 7-phosphate (DAHP) synthase